MFYLADILTILVDKIQGKCIGVLKFQISDIVSRDFRLALREGATGFVGVGCYYCPIGLGGFWLLDIGYLYQGSWILEANSSIFGIKKSSFGHPVRDSALSSSVHASAHKTASISLKTPISIEFAAVLILAV